MSTVEDIEKAVGSLDKQDLSSFRDWFKVFDRAQWDAQIEQDISAGKLDDLAAEAINEHSQGKTRSL
jgi:hypothetical protein